jgi:hypothetical protein
LLPLHCTVLYCIVSHCLLNSLTDCESLILVLKLKRYELSLMT